MVGAGLARAPHLHLSELGSLGASILRSFLPIHLFEGGLGFEALLSVLSDSDIRGDLEVRLHTGCSE